MGASSLRHAFIDIYELCCYSINNDPLFYLIRKGKDPGDHIGIYIYLLPLVREDVMRNSIECFSEVE